MNGHNSERRAITYPVAYSVTEEAIIHITDAPRERGVRYSCVHCDQRVSAVVLVTRKTPHFRHTDPEVRCDPDAALHTYAIKMIQQTHNVAQERGIQYMLTRPCREGGYRHCQNFATEIDLAEGWECADEESIVPHTRTDLAFTHSDGRQIAVEIVNTHEMEPETESAYRSAGVPVAIVRVEWETIRDLLNGLDIHSSRNFDKDVCDECGQRQKESADRLDRRRRTVDIVLSRMDRRRSSKPLFRPWYYGKPGMFSDSPTPMYPRTQRQVFANAIILTELGFIQHNPQKPWLFRYPIHEKQNVILYADLGGSDVVPIYEDTAAMLYVFGSSLDDDDEDGHYECCSRSPISHYIIEEAGKRLQQFGVDVRTGFLSAEQMEQTDVDPLNNVDGNMLSGLLSIGVQTEV